MRETSVWGREGGRPCTLYSGKIIRLINKLSTIYILRKKDEILVITNQVNSEHTSLRETGRVHCTQRSVRYCSWLAEKGSRDQMTASHVASLRDMWSGSRDLRAGHVTAGPAVIGGEKSLDLRIYWGDQASDYTELREDIDLRESRDILLLGSVLPKSTFRKKFVVHFIQNTTKQLCSMLTAFLEMSLGP